LARRARARGAGGGDLRGRADGPASTAAPGRLRRRADRVPRRHPGALRPWFLRAARTAAPRLVRALGLRPRRARPPAVPRRPQHRVAGLVRAARGPRRAGRGAGRGGVRGGGGVAVSAPDFAPKNGGRARVIVIGSGAGGAVTALELAKHGREVLV